MSGLPYNPSNFQSGTGDVTLQYLQNNYYDAAVTQSLVNSRVPLAGGTMTGNLVMGSSSNINLNSTGSITNGVGVTATTLTGTLATASQPNITGVGTITTGVWNGTAIDAAHGGTGISTPILAGEVLIGNAISGFTPAFLSQGSGIGITSGAGSITIANSGVTSIAGTANQVIASGSTGGVTLSTPQAINSGASPTFANVNLTGVSNGVMVQSSSAVHPATLTSNLTLTGGTTLDTVQNIGLTSIPSFNGLIFGVTTVGSPLQGELWYDSGTNSLLFNNGSSSINLTPSSFVPTSIYLSFPAIVGGVVNQPTTVASGTNGIAFTTNGVISATTDVFAINNNVVLQSHVTPILDSSAAWSPGSVAAGVYAFSYTLDCSMDRPIVTISESVTSTTLRSGVDLYLSTDTCTLAFTDYIRFSSTTSPTFVVSSTGKNGGSTGYFILFVNQLQLTRIA